MKKSFAATILILATVLLFSLTGPAWTGYRFPGIKFHYVSVGGLPRQPVRRNFNEDVGPGEDGSVAKNQACQSSRVSVNEIRLELAITCRFCRLHNGFDGARIGPGIDSATIG